jgi:LmbE family N-acetylglucosaminyl deacetylase
MEDELAQVLGQASAPVLVVGAHPDDETVGAGALLARLARRGEVRVVTVTDGAPLDPSRRDARHDPGRLLHAARRRGEVLAALAVAGVDEARWSGLRVVDQEAPLAIGQVARALVERVRAHGVVAIVTHAYEGGHPDHDAVAVAAHAACALLRREGARPPSLVEMPLYHAAGGDLVLQDFVGGSGLTRPLTPEERERKARMLAAHASQHAVLAPFTTEHERFRLAPAHDFLRPPHEGPLHYESQPWRWTGAAFRAQVGAAASALGLGAPPWA